MDRYTVFPDRELSPAGPVSEEFLRREIRRFHDACRWVHELPYGYNSDRDERMILFRENKGTCTTKHAVIGTLAAEQGLDVRKNVGIYAMTEEIVTGTKRLLDRFGLPYIPMVHCFLVHERFRVDLTEGNRNGKNRPIEGFLHVEEVPAAISGKEEYLLYRRVLAEKILRRPELAGVDLRRVLQAREEGLKLLKENLLR
ncbi:MAG: hypothetical protein WHT06_04335 [Desulfobacterales bacterium]